MGITAKGMKRAIFFDPYLDTLGGGERYFLTLAVCLTKKAWQVDIWGFSSKFAKKAANIFGFELKGVNFVNKDLSQLNLLEKRKLLSRYNLCFYVSDGSVPWLFAKKNLLHLQVPFQHVGGRGLLNQLKLRKIDQVVCNSHFTKKFIDREFNLDSLVIEPPVAVDKFKPGKKENIILSLGRFTDFLHNKRQDVLMEAFKDLVARLKSGWRLVLIGGDKEGKVFVKKLRKLGRGYPVEIRTNLSFGEVVETAGRAKVFWTATGFGIDEEKHPEQVEHFGITTVEAMAAGCVPVVIAKGGQKEIVDHGINGYLWQNKEELIKLTGKLVGSETLLKRLSCAAVEKSHQFSIQSFCEKYEKIIL